MQLQRIRFKYTKDLIHIGHLDMVRLFERAIRRTDIAVAYTEGFNQRHRISFGPPLSVGVYSTCELMDIYFENNSNCEQIKNDLNNVLPKGICITETKNIFPQLPSITAAVKFADYLLETDELKIDIIEDHIKQVMRSKEIMSKRRDKEVNIRPFIEDIRIQANKEKTNILLTSKFDEKGTLKGSEILNLFITSHTNKIIRTNLY